jgi:hypothetical protein
VLKQHRFLHSIQFVRVSAGTILGILVLLVVNACGDDPFEIQWELQADTVLLYSLARPEMNMDSGFNFRPGTLGPVRIEAATATGTWDLALDTRGGELVFLPPGALGVSSRARVTAIPNKRREEVIEAPADTTVYSVDQPVPVRSGTVYVVRTDRAPGAFGSRCFYYARLEPTLIDVEGGNLTFVYDASPVCNSRRLIPRD